MLRRESGWAMDPNDRDVWTKQKDVYGRLRFDSPARAQRISADRVQIYEQYQRELAR